MLSTEKGRIVVAFLMACMLVLPASGRAAEGTAIDWYGFFKLDMAYDSARSSHGNFAMWTRNYPVDDATAITSITARQTRIGFDVAREEMKGKLEFDFYGGPSAENKNFLQLRKAYVDLPLGAVSLRAGQDSDLISPLVPATVNYTVCWGVGNIGYRRPQLRIYQQSGGLYWGLALARNISPDLNGDGIVDGNAGTPIAQGRVAYSLQSGDMKITVGGSGHYGIMDSPGAAEEDYNSWSANGEIKVVVNPKLTVLGEFYTGSNMATYFGSILNADSADGLASSGGWANVQYKASDLLALSLGGSLDSVDEDDLAGEGARSSNLVIFGNAQYHLGSGVKTGIELSHWTTEFPHAPAGMESKPTSLRLQFSVLGSF
ncbi:MAG: hypothetical protein HOC74_26125 [Gemmatimonadetes bacterium]|jgi:hypothetical protein|nr:hypothetical protein [Gemmatimonadota bacterium]